MRTMQTSAAFCLVMLALAGRCHAQQRQATAGEIDAMPFLLFSVMGNSLLSAGAQEAAKNAPDTLGKVSLGQLPQQPFDDPYTMMLHIQSRCCTELMPSYPDRAGCFTALRPNQPDMNPGPCKNCLDGSQQPLNPAMPFPI